MQGEKASGALNRLHLEGRQIGLVGKTVEGKSFDSKALGRGPILSTIGRRGANRASRTWGNCENCKPNMRDKT